MPLSLVLAENQQKRHRWTHLVNALPALHQSQQATLPKHGSTVTKPQWLLQRCRCLLLQRCRCHLLQRCCCLRSDHLRGAQVTQVLLLLSLMQPLLHALQQFSHHWPHAQ
jgi:hypothetical protein